MVLCACSVSALMCSLSDLVMLTPSCPQRKDVRPVKQFQLRRWASGDLPERALHLTDMIRDVKRSQSESSTPIVVHCR